MRSPAPVRDGVAAALRAPCFTGFVAASSCAAARLVRADFGAALAAAFLRLSLAAFFAASWRVEDFFSSDRGARARSRSSLRVRGFFFSVINAPRSEAQP